MSLTEVIKDKRIKELFRREFKKPKYKINHLIKVPPLTNNYMLVGLAFDYLFKFYVKYYNIPKGDRWLNYFLTILKYWKTEKFIDIPFSEFDLLLKGTITDNIIKASIIAAQVSKRVPNNKIGKIDPQDIKDLRNLFSIININKFKSNSKCIVNSNFNQVSKLVKGAICDIIIDDKLIDIKTTGELSVNEGVYYQTIGYYLLSVIEGRHDIKEIGFYFSRYGVTYLYKIDELVNLENIPVIVDEFINIVGEKYGT
ncbi:MAG: hypothetical protein HF967_04735 [Methanosarcinales archaeon]|nr:hypothetical protein [Methanosarcinales archaeon]